MKRDATMKSRDVVDFEVLYEGLTVGHGGKSKPLREALADAMDQLGKAAKSSGSASLVLTIAVKAGKSRGLMHLTGTLKTILPEPAPMPIEVYSGRRGELLADDPDQLKLGEIESLEGVDVG